MKKCVFNLLMFDENLFALDHCPASRNLSFTILKKVFFIVSKKDKNLINFSKRGSNLSDLEERSFT